MTVKPNETIQQCVDVLDRIINDNSVPRNIRRNGDNVKKILLDDKETPSVRAAMVISTLDEMGNDPNVPIHTRTLVWGISSQLESIPVDE